MSPGPVWIDLANSPHVLFFTPIIGELRRRGVLTTVSARDFAQTTQLCTRFGIDAEVVGRHGGASLSGKLLGLAERVSELRAFAHRTRPCVAVSHNSYSQTVAARSLRLPVMTAMDYEYQPANHLAFRCADLVAAPEVVVAGGRLHLLHDAYDLTRIPPRKKAAAPTPRISDALVA